MKINQILSDWNPIDFEDSIRLEEYLGIVPNVIKLIEKKSHFEEGLTTLLNDYYGTSFSINNTSYFKDLRIVKSRLFDLNYDSKVAGNKMIKDDTIESYIFIRHQLYKVSSKTSGLNVEKELLKWNKVTFMDDFDKGSLSKIRIIKNAEELDEELKIPYIKFLEGKVYN